MNFSNNNKVDIEVLDNLIIGRVEPKIYAFTTHTIPNYLKVGDTYRPVETRLDEWRKYFPNLEKKFEGVAKIDEQTFFRDYSVHHFLENDVQRSRLELNSIDDIPYYSREFFKDASENDVDAAIKDIKKGHASNDPKYQYYKFEGSHIPLTHTYSRTENYKPRPNQKKTIEKFKEAFQKNRTNLLMYAVMRFGKSFTSMCCAVEMNANTVVIVSAKADVKEEWKMTVESHVKFNGYSFIDSHALSRNETLLAEKIRNKEKTVIFLTLQDLQGDTIKTRHKEIFENKIDLLLIDETHFGARAEEFGKVLRQENLSRKEEKSEFKLNDNTIDELDITTKVINPRVRIHLSGTPYRILMNSEFEDDDIIAFYQFTDIADDQEEWDRENLNKDEIKEWDNPYYGFPQMIRFAFNPNESSRRKIEEMKRNGVTYAFSSLFKPKSIIKDNENNLHKQFKHEREIVDLLNIIDGKQEDENLLSFLDYDKLKEGKMCRHIVFVLPFRASCDAMENLLKTRRFKNFGSYEAVNISGVDGDKKYPDTQSVQSKIKKCETENIKTITLTVNRMLTGSTVPQWDTMFYFKDTASPQEYDQAIFRLQNQYIKTFTEPGGDTVKYNMKPQTLLVDFNPNRMFQMQEHKSQIYNVNTESNGNTKLVERIRRELEISPIIALNNNKIIQVQPSDILDAVREYSNSRSVFDEATTISVDYELLNIDAIRLEIEKQAKIGSRQGIEIKASEGDGDELDPGDMPENGESTGSDAGESHATDEETVTDYRGQFAMYYARILFFAFLIDSKVTSLQGIIDHIDNDIENKRIASNLNLNKSVLELLQKHINPFILSELDYKIHNINSLANDSVIEPIERASNAMKKFSRLSDSEIVTPETVAEEIIGSLPARVGGAKKLFIDIASKQGEFVHAAYKKFGKEVASNFYSIPTSKIAYEFTRKVYRLLELDVTHIENSYTSYDLIENSELIENKSISINNKPMKFDVIVGNPPYQKNTKGHGRQAKPIYHDFVNIALNLEPEIISMIIQSRWFTGGMGLSNFRSKMMNDSRIKKIHDYTNSKDCFPGLSISGGVCYFLWDKNYNGDCTFVNNYYNKTSKTSRKLNEFAVIVRYNEAVNILRKLPDIEHSNLSDLVQPINVFNLPSSFRGLQNDSKNSITVVHSNGIGYINSEKIKQGKELLEKYKVAVSRTISEHAGEPGKDGKFKVLAKTMILKPNHACTHSYLVIGPFANSQQADVLNKYLQTSFVRFLILQTVSGIDLSEKRFMFVPVQNFSTKSDIDWKKPIEEIDSQLYKKYKLTKEEIKFIKSMIKPMA